MSDTPEKKNTDIKEIILAKIRMEKLTMRPKAYFTLQIIAFSLVIIGVLLTTIFICNFILFTIRVNGHDALLGFGWQGVVRFLEFFPWLLLAFDIILIILLEWLVRKFRFGYKSPVLYLLLIIFGFIVILGAVIDRGTLFNDELLDHADHNHLLPPLGNFYEHARHHHSPDSGICKCTIIGINGNILIVEDRTPEKTSTLSVLVSPDNPSIDIRALQVGEMVFIAGQYHDNMIDAYGIHPFIPFSSTYQ